MPVIAMQRPALFRRQLPTWLVANSHARPCTWRRQQQPQQRYRHYHPRGMATTVSRNEPCQDVHDAYHDDTTNARGGGGGPLKQQQQQQQQQHSSLCAMPPIYVAATRQHVGKTSTSLALLSGLLRRFPQQVGFMKPVGQHTVVVHDDNGQSYTVDKDAALVKQHFALHQVRYEHISPVLIPPGYTRDYVNGHIPPAAAPHQKIMDAYHAIASSNHTQVVLCEGTGHCAVGSIIEAGNAQVASWLGAHMVLVANGGLGHTFDELVLNKTICDQHNVPIAGVIVNKVQPDKYAQTKHYLSKVLRERWNVPLLGCVPDRPFLGCPALGDLERLFGGSILISGHAHRLRHYRVPDMNLVATSLEVFMRTLRRDPVRTLYVCHASRNDLLLGFLMEATQRTAGAAATWEAALVVTGCAEHPLSTQVLNMVQQSRLHPSPPVLCVPHATRDAMEMMHAYTPKLNYEDGHRVEKAVSHYEPYIDFDLLLQRVGGGVASPTAAAASATAATP